MRNISLALLGLFFLSHKAFTQIQVSDTATLTQAIQALVSEGVQISNISSNCASTAWGTFEDTTGVLGIEEGLCLASGSIWDIPGPNNDPGAGQNLLTPGDVDLNALGVGTTQDACYVQFDVTPSADTLVFNYVFGSEEYDEYVCSNFNDVFAFFISGPGITGKQNIALIPGTNTPVSINNVNQGNPAAFPPCPATNPAYFVTNPTGAPELQYDGRTVVLQAMTPVTPCETYTLKLAVADVSDGILDSGVFIEKGSLGSFGAEISPSSAYARFEYGVEGCNAGKFIFIRTIADTFEVPLRWELGGTATNGIDYVDENGDPLGNADTIPAFVDSLEIVVYPVFDTVSDPIETIELTLFDPCDDTTSVPTGDAVVLFIREEFIYNAGEDDSICVGDIIELNSEFYDGDSVLWTPTTGLSCATCPNPLANPTTTTTYILRVFDSVTSCPASDSLTVNVFEYPDPNIISISDSSGWICEGTTLVLFSGLENDPLYDFMTFKWDSSTSYINATDTSVVWVRPNDDHYFPLTVTNEIGCSIRDSILITVIPWPEVDFPEDYNLCFDASTQVVPDLTFFPNVGYSYLWEPASNGQAGDISDTQISSPVISPSSEGRSKYLLTVSNGICESAAEVTMEMEEEIEVEYQYDSLDEFLKVPQSISFENTTFTPFKYKFLWRIENLTTSSVDSIFAVSLNYQFFDPDPFEVTLEAHDTVLNCVAFYTEDFQFEDVVRPNTITPNGDGKNDVFVIEAPSSQTWLIRIYNRHGALIFESPDYQNDWGGENVGAGVYYYVISTEDTDENYVGYIEVLK